MTMFLRHLLGSLLIGMIVVAGALVSAQEPTQKPDEKKVPSISMIMKEAHKRPHHLLKKVATGKANTKEKERLLELYKALAKSKPPKGDSDSWQTRTELLVTAAESALAGNVEGSKELTKAANCTTCHDSHKD